MFNNQAQPLVAGGTLNGPTTNVTVRDVISHYGARSPDYTHAQKCFRVATMLVTRDALAPANAMSLYDFFASRTNATTPQAYTDGLSSGTALPFKTVTGGEGCLDSRIKRHILIDSSRDGGVWWFPQSGPFSSSSAHQGKPLADYLVGQGHTVVELPRPTTITPALLADYNIVIRVVGLGAYTSAEIAAYDAWVTAGGGLLLLSDHHPNDALASHFGLQFQGITDGQRELSTFVAHPITTGVGPIFYGAGSGLTAHPAAATVIVKLSAATFLDLNDNNKQDHEAGCPARRPASA